MGYVRPASASRREGCPSDGRFSFLLSDAERKLFCQTLSKLFVPDDCDAGRGEEAQLLVAALKEVGLTVGDSVLAMQRLTEPYELRPVPFL